MATNIGKDKSELERDNKLTRAFYSGLFIVSLQLYISICAYLFIDSQHLEGVAAVVTAVALAISLFTRAFIKKKNVCTNFFRIFGDYIAVVFTLSTIMKVLEFHPWSIITLTFIVVALYAVALLKEQ